MTAQNGDIDTYFERVQSLAHTIVDAGLVVQRLH
jgi:hypothetical protein